MVRHAIQWRRLDITEFQRASILPQLHHTHDTETLCLVCENAAHLAETDFRKSGIIVAPMISAVICYSNAASRSTDRRDGKMRSTRRVTLNAAHKARQPSAAPTPKRARSAWLPAMADGPRRS